MSEVQCKGCQLFMAASEFLDEGRQVEKCATCRSRCIECNAWPGQCDHISHLWENELIGTLNDALNEEGGFSDHPASQGPIIGGVSINLATGQVVNGLPPGMLDGMPPSLQAIIGQLIGQGCGNPDCKNCG